MYRLFAENQKNEKIELSNSPYFYVKIEGLLPGKATLHTTTVINNDGSILNSVRKDNRDITITVILRMPVAENRQRVYKYFKIKSKVTLYFETDNRDVKIKGTVESVEGSLFDQQQTIEIGIICTDPYFEEKIQRIVNMAQVLDLFEFPFAIEEEGIEFSRIDKTLTQGVYNDGDTETGVVIELSAMGEVVNPIIRNVETRGYFGLNIEMQLGDVIQINTNNFNKKVTLQRYGEIRNIINSIMKGNEWFKLMPGDNIFTYQCEKGEENLSVRFIYSNKYEGV